MGRLSTTECTYLPTYLLGTEITKSRVVPPAAGVTGDCKTVQQQDPLLASQTITIKATEIAALVHEAPKRFMEIDKNLIVIKGDIFAHLDPKTMCPAWLYEEMAHADTLIRGSQTVIDNMNVVLDTETERRLNDDFTAPRMANICCVHVPYSHLQLANQTKGSSRSYIVGRLLVGDLVTG